MHNPQIIILLVYPVNVQLKTEAVDFLAQVEGADLAAVKFKSDEVRLAERKGGSRVVLSLVACERPRVDSELLKVVAELLVDRVCQLLELCLHDLLPLVMLGSILRQNVNLYKMLITRKEAKPLEEQGPFYFLLGFCSFGVRSLDWIRNSACLDHLAVRRVKNEMKLTRS